MSAVCHPQQPAKLYNLKMKGDLTYTEKYILDISITIKVIL